MFQALNDGHRGEEKMPKKLIEQKVQLEKEMLEMQYGDQIQKLKKQVESLTNQLKEGEGDKSRYEEGSEMSKMRSNQKFEP